MVVREEGVVIRGQAERLHEELAGGGYSEHIPTGTKPSPPGYMVSDFGSERQVPQHLSSPQIISEYVKQHGLEGSPPSEYAGGWRPDKEEGVAPTDYLDVSRKYENPSAMRFAMVTQNQKAAYDLSKPFDHPDAYVSNPDYIPDFDESKQDPLAVLPTWLRPFTGSTPKIRTVRKAQ
jgi:hypothetical protein